MRTMRILSLPVRLYVNTSIKKSRVIQYKSLHLPSYKVKQLDTLSINSFVLYTSEGTVPSSIHSFAFTTVLFSRLSSFCFQIFTTGWKNEGFLSFSLRAGGFGVCLPCYYYCMRLEFWMANLC